MIKKLENPQSDYYKEFKSLVLSNVFPWYFEDATTVENIESSLHENFGVYYHEFLLRPGRSDDIWYSRESSPHVTDAYNIVTEILKYNDIGFDIIYRIGANCVHTTEKRKYCMMHQDHLFPHQNLLIYLTDPERGDTEVAGKSFFGKEDDVILFEGEHCHRPPNRNRRIVLITTLART